MQVQINFNKKVALALLGPALIVFALFLASFVPDEHPHFVQILMGFLSIIMGGGGVVTTLVTAVTYFSEGN